MPVLDGRHSNNTIYLGSCQYVGVAATAEIRQLEAARSDEPPGAPQTRILALTGMSSLEDKRRAFEAGVDG